MASDLQTIFGEVIRELRLKARLSQEELSFACGRHRTYVSLIERGKNAPSILTLWALAEALDVTPSKIIRRVEVRLDQSHLDQRRARSKP
jgi:transcriptional regulator with XRE-family HTH domain